jgi:hypothetical protein
MMDVLGFGLFILILCVGFAFFFAIAVTAVQMSNGRSFKDIWWK